MPSPLTGLLGVSSVVLVLLFYFASSDLWETLSPQGCRMSWMSPSYVLQADFDAKWSPLARRYSLWLYREVGWDPVQDIHHKSDSVPVLFIPGNAGSSQQVRSIASSATRQYFSSPFVISPPFISRPLKPLDFFAVEFNEDLSAFHGSTLEAEIEYTSKAISYILSLYPAGTQIIVMGHSMGGIVATSLLPSSNISTIITLSTPHTLPPARFDSRINTLYTRLQGTLKHDITPIVSLCGGATDAMIPSESCILPTPSSSVFRRTIFSSALEGAWTGVGHREMVWCHQVRWRVGRAALELGGATTPSGRATILDRWLRDGHALPPNLPAESDELVVEASSFDVLQMEQPLVLKQPSKSWTYLLPVRKGLTSLKVTMLVSQGSVLSVAPQNPIPLQVSVLLCRGRRGLDDSKMCQSLKPTSLKLIPHPDPLQPFPVPNQGSDESEGIVFYEATVDDAALSDSQEDYHVAVKLEHADGQGWVVATVAGSSSVTSHVSTLDLLTRSEAVHLPNRHGLSVSINFPNLLPNSLLVYRLTSLRRPGPACADNLLPPLIMHTSHPAETHYFPLIHASNKRILLHSHLSAPFIERSAYDKPVLDIVMISSPEPRCKEEILGIEIIFDWKASLGRCASRYLNTLVSWAIGVVATIIFLAWGQENRGGIPGMSQAMANYVRLMLRYLLPASFFASFLPLRESLYLGNGGNPVFSLLAPMTLVVASGLVVVTWWILQLLVFIVSKVNTVVFRSRRRKTGVPTSTLLSLGTICVVIFLFVPWQVAYLGCWILMLHTCSSLKQEVESLSKERIEAIPLMGASSTRRQSNPTPRASGPSCPQDIQRSNYHHSLLLLLLMTWLLPLAAPVLAVWIRTLLTAGFTTPFDGDHNFLSVLPFLVLTDFASWVPGPLFKTSRFESNISLRWLFAGIAGTAFLLGSRWPYLVFDGTRTAIAVIVVARIGRRYVTSEKVDE